MRFLAAMSAFSGSTRYAVVRPVIKPCTKYKLTNRHSPKIQNRQDYPVLHRTSIEIVRYKSIQLRQRILYIERLLVERKCLLFNVEGILSLVDHIRRS